MDLNGIKSFLGQDWTEVVKQIGDSLHSDIDYLNSANDMILSHSGKQLRPLLSLMIARACSDSGITEASIRYAAAAELLHNATLLHDDVADDSEQRRGAPTIMSLMGPSVSVLLGDYWLVKAMENVLGNDSEKADSDNRATRIFSKTLSDLACGEMLQLQKADSGDTDRTDYERIIYSKTASLFEAAARTAALSVGASKEVEEAVARYAVALGMAFQIRDDIFDYSPSSAEVGKPVGVDILEQKITLPLLEALSVSAEDEAAAIRRKVVEIKEHPEYRDEIVDFVRRNRGVECANSRLDEFIAEAVAALDVLPSGQEKVCLTELAYFVGKRVS